MIDFTSQTTRNLIQYAAADRASEKTNAIIHEIIIIPASGYVKLKTTKYVFGKNLTKQAKLGKIYRMERGDCIRNKCRIIILLCIAFMIYNTACASGSIAVGHFIDEKIAKDTVESIYDPPGNNFNRLVRGSAADLADSIPIDTITLSFVGDCMLASYRGEYNWNTFNYRADNEDPAYFFAGVSDILKTDDFTVANCENVFTDNDLPAINKGYEGAYWYKSKSANASIFTAGGIDMISLANNHTYDYGLQGKKDTIAAAESACLLWGDDNNPVIIEKYGFRIAILCSDIMIYANSDRLIETLTALAETTDFRIVFFHGGTERVYTPPENIVNLARKFVDVGADLVIGHHPHVLQPIERYNGVNIVYSLGNFLFGAGRGENRTIIYQYILNIAGGVLLDTYENIIPCYVYDKRWQPAVIADEGVKKRVMDFLDGKSENPM